MGNLTLNTIIEVTSALLILIGFELFNRKKLSLSI